MKSLSTIIKEAENRLQEVWQTYLSPEDHPKTQEILKSFLTEQITKVVESALEEAVNLLETEILAKEPNSQEMAEEYRRLLREKILK